MKYDFTSHVDRGGTGAFKTDRNMVKGYLGLNYYDDTISMWVAEMDFACSPHIVERLKERCDKLIFGYSGATPQYYSSIMRWYRDRYGVMIDPSWIVTSNGTVLAIRNAIKAFTDKGDKIIIQSPVYYPFSSEIKETGRVMLDNQLLKDENNNYSIDFADFEEKCKEAKMFIYCNPHNPIGKIWSKEETQQLIDIANKYGVIVFSDEVHSDLIRRDMSFTTAIGLENTDNVVVATAINKTFNLAGLAATNLIIRNLELRKRLSSFTGMVMLSPFAMEATIAAYKDSAEWVDQLREVIDENLRYMYEFIKEKLPKVKFNIPEGTYLAWIDLNAYGVSEQELIHAFANEAHIILEGGSMFGKMGDGFIRMNVACPKTVLVEAMERMYKLLHDYKSSKFAGISFAAPSDCSCGCSCGPSNSSSCC